MRIAKAIWIPGVAIIAAACIIFLSGVQKGHAARLGANASKTVAVKIDNFSFDPANVKISAGTTVIWTNNDDIPHTVVSDDTKTFKSRALDTGDHFSFTFSKPGKYSYFCSVHPRMTAQVVVQ